MPQSKTKKKDPRRQGTHRIPEDAYSADLIDQLDSLTIREAAFVQHYLRTDHAPLSAAKAGYGAQTCRKASDVLLKRPNIQAAITTRRQALCVETGVTAQDVINELKKLAFANLSNYSQINQDGDPVVDLTGTTHAQMAALSEASTESYMEGKGKDAVRVKKVKIKMHDKLGALEKLGKHLGIFNDRTEHTGADGGPITIAQRWKVELVPCPTPNQPPPSLIQ